METLKFNEYSALRNKLQEEGYSINEFVKQITGEFLNEDDQTLDTKKPGIMWLTSRKGAKTMKGLTREAKKVQKIIQTNILAKHYPKILENQKKILQQAQALIKRGKSKEQVQESLKRNIRTAEMIQAKQLASLNAAIDQIIDNSGRKITSYINGKNLSDKRKLTIENYWVLLTTQLHQIAYNSMIDKEESFLQDIIRENEDLVTFADEVSVENDIDKWIEEDKKKAAEAKAKIKEDTIDDKEEPEKEPETKDQSSGKPVKEFKKGEVWQYVGVGSDKKKKTKYGKIVVVGPGKTAKGEDIPAGRVQLERVERIGGRWEKKTLEGKGSLYTISDNVLKRRSAKLMKEALPEETFDPDQYKEGEKYNYRNSKGQEGVIEIINKEDGGIRVKQSGKKGNGWIVKKDGQILDKVEK